jgi:hypothetical protein
MGDLLGLLVSIRLREIGDGLLRLVVCDYG